MIEGKCVIGFETARNGCPSTAKFGLILKKISKNDKCLVISQWQVRGEAWHRAPEGDGLKNVPPRGGGGRRPTGNPIPLKNLMIRSLVDKFYKINYSPSLN